MNAHKVKQCMALQITRCIDTLETKAKEYVTGDDRLEHFKLAAAEQETTPKAALWGMASKHTTSLGRMCREGEHPVELWDEKITDAINYLLLLRTLVEEDTKNE